jgi:thiamine pyrophosphate-dependent acetolactate synthase large subunit-like protein
MTTDIDSNKETQTTSAPVTEEEAASNTQVSISEWIANAIADTASEHRKTIPIFAGHGGALVPLVNAVEAHARLQFVYARNEHDAATMAAAYAKLTGELGVVIATSGPGATNLTTGLMEAVLDRVPLLAITGLKPTAVMGYSEFQDVAQSRLFAAAGLPFSKSAASASAVIPLLRDAVATALTQRSAAHLAIPVDIQAAPSPLPLKHFCASHAHLRLQQPALNLDSIRPAARTLVVGGEHHEYHPPRTVIAVGHMAQLTDSRMSRAILDLAESLNAPVLTRLDAKGAVDESHPLAFGVIGVHGKPGLEAAALLISTADIVLSIGVQDETLLLCNTAGLQIRKLIEIQPDAVAVANRFNAEHTLLGEVYEVVQSLTEEVERLALKMKKKRDLRDASNQRRRLVQADHFAYMHYENPTFLNEASSRSIHVSDPDPLTVSKLSTEADELWEAMHNGDWTKLQNTGLKNGSRGFKFNGDESENFCHPAAVLYALSDLRTDPSTDKVSRNATVTVDVGDVTLWASLCLKLAGGSRTLCSERLGTMGYALNAAVAAVFAQPEPSGAVVLAGDGGFQMSLQELATFQQLKRPGDKLLCIILDNGVLGRVAFGFDSAAGCDIGGPDYVALAKAYGGDGVFLNNSAEAPKIVKEALEADGLFVIHVAVDPTVRADMATFKDNSLAVMNSG